MALGGLAIWRAYRIERIPRSFWVVLTIGLAFWILGGFDLKPGRVPWASRYQLLGGIFVLLVAAELLRGVPLGRRLLGPALVVVAASVASNGLFLHEAYESYASSSEIVRGNLTALEIARDTVDPSFYLEEEFADTGFDHIDAGSYFAAVDDFGSPAYTVAELRASGEPARFAADKVLLNALRVGVEPIASSAVPAKHCFAAAPGEEFAVPTGGVAIAPARSRSPTSRCAASRRPRKANRCRSTSRPAPVPAKRWRSRSPSTSRRSPGRCGSKAGRRRSARSKP